jgi:peroxiredoxin
VGLLAKLLLAAALGLAAVPAWAAKVGDAAPPFEVTTFDRQKISSADLKGKVIVINYWATWSAPCRLELPVLDDFLRGRPQGDLVVFAVATEDSVPPAKLKPLAGLLSFPLVAKLSGRGYGILGGAVPTNYVIDRTGVIRHAKARAFTEDELEELLEPLLAEPAPSVAPRRTASAD